MLTMKRTLIGMIVIAAILIGHTAYANNFEPKKRETKQSKSRKKEMDVKGKIFYTTANMWYEKPDNFCSINFHKGMLIPAGTKVEILKYRGHRINFSYKENGETYSYIHSTKHSKIKLDELFDRYFSKESVMAEGGKFSKFTKREQEDIEQGIIVPGMSKDAVLMAYGYPPTHKTPNLTSDAWTYWNSRAGRIIVYFKDGVISKVEGSSYNLNTASSQE